MAEPSALQPLKSEQARASRPDAHVWLSASAGTGKTHVLSARVLRLLLAGTPPERILCLTFTKAGAAEMAERVHSRLARWVQADSPDVAKDLIALGEDYGPEAVARARLLFARVLDSTGGGLRIQTIHSFCQALLAAFPLEAGLVPGFRPLDERAQAELSRAALIEMFETAERDRDEALIAAVEALALRLGEAGTIAYLARSATVDMALAQIRARLGPDHNALTADVEALLFASLKLPLGDIEEELAKRCSDVHVPRGLLERLATANRDWGAKTGLAAADAIAQWLAADEAGRVPQIASLLGMLLTQKGEVKNRDKDKLLAAAPDYVEQALEIGACLQSLIDLRKQVAYARLAAQGLEAGRAYSRAYAAAKQCAGFVDFDDLIGRASDLLAQDGISDWIRYKLDQRVDHILVDEAQDTNDDQWHIVWSIIEEYFEAELEVDRGALRTLFVVGDTKQAIFGFQGTSPEAFMGALRRFRERAERTGHSIDALPLALSFRSMPAVLDVVDATLAQIGPAEIGLEALPEPHRAAREHPGRVLLLPPTVIGAGATSDEETEDEAPERDAAEDISGDESWLADHQRRHAEKIADQVKAWLQAPIWLHSHGREVRPGDILILLRSRSALSRLIVARLYEAGVPVAGVDRLRLQAPLAVRDLLAALRFAVQPDDDLNLANLLVSPLMGWSQDDLMHRALRDDGVSLWSHLRATLPAEHQTPLRALLASADFTTPYRYLEAILSGSMDGRRKLIARLGEEARDAIDELVNAALGFEADDHPSLQRFIDWFDRGDADIKRELAESGDMVRVMTVHGSKGLEAPIVVLADAAFDPATRPRTDSVALRVAGVALPLVRPGKGEATAEIARAMEDTDRAEMEEHWRLLYVAMTRAEEMLVVTGALGPRAKGEPPQQSWHRMIQMAMRQMEAAPVSLDGWGEGLQWLGPPGLPDARPKPARARDASDVGARPDWLRNPAPAEARPPRPLAPSAAAEDDVPDPPPDAALRRAAERGRLLHALFERLPELAPVDRAEAAERWLAGPGKVADGAERASLIAHVRSVIDDPAHAALFGPQALAEAPITAVVGEQVIAGTVDRLLVTDGLVHVVDFKTGRFAPQGLDSVPLAHLRQMAAYAAALSVIFPDREIRASLLYSSAPRLIDLPSDLLAPHKPGLAATQEKLSSSALESAGPAA